MFNMERRKKNLFWIYNGDILCFKFRIQKKFYAASLSDNAILPQTLRIQFCFWNRLQVLVTYLELLNLHKYVTRTVRTKPRFSMVPNLSGFLHSYWMGIDGFWFPFWCTTALRLLLTNLLKYAPRKVHAILLRSFIKSSISQQTHNGHYILWKL